MNKIRLCLVSSLNPHFRFQSPGYSTEMLTSSLDQYEYPAGNYWQQNNVETRPSNSLARFKKRRQENDK